MKVRMAIDMDSLRRALRLRARRMANAAEAERLRERERAARRAPAGRRRGERRI